MVSLGELEVNLPLQILQFDPESVLKTSYMGTDKNGEFRYNLNIAVECGNRISIKILSLRNSHSDGSITTFVKEAVKVGIPVGEESVTQPKTYSSRCLLRTANRKRSLPEAPTTAIATSSNSPSGNVEQTVKVSRVEDSPLCDPFPVSIRQYSATVSTPQYSLPPSDSDSGSYVFNQSKEASIDQTELDVHSKQEHISDMTQDNMHFDLLKVNLDDDNVDDDSISDGGPPIKVESIAGDYEPDAIPVQTGLEQHIANTANNMPQHALPTSQTSKKLKDGKFQCKVCKKVYKNELYLLSHTKFKHQGVNFACEMCPKTFRDKTTLRNHLKSHMGYRFVCHVCGCAYKSNSNLVSHINIQHKRVRYKCDVCCKEFVRRKHKCRKHFGKQEGA